MSERLEIKMGIDFVNDFTHFEKLKLELGDDLPVPI